MNKFLSILLLLFCATAPLRAETPAWKTTTYTLTAREMELHQALDTFGMAQGIPVIISEAVPARPFSGTFKDMPPEEFLDRIATINNLSWYYDGAALYFYGAGEVLTTLLDLRHMKADELCQMLRELGVEDSRFPIKATSNGQLLMVSGPPRYVQLVAETVERADKLREERSLNEIEMRLFPLKYTWADDVSFNVSGAEGNVSIKGIATLLTDMMNKTTPQNTRSVVYGDEAADKEGISKEDLAALQQAALFQPVIKPDNRLNAVLIRDAAIRMPVYERIIKQLDTQQKLVEITVTILDMSKDDSLDWQLSLKVDGGKGRFKGGIGQEIGGLTTVDDLGGSGLAGALSYLGSNFNLQTSLTALKQKHKARSVFRTMVLTLNNMSAQVEDTRTFYAKVTGKEAVSFEKVTAGTTLKLRPRIVQEPNGVPPLVWLTMDLTDGGFDSLSTVDEMPMSSASNLTTQAAVYNQESILLAGYLHDVDEEAKWGIPWLRDIPFIGWIFGGTMNKTETVQRIFIITPRVLDLDTETLARIQASQLRDLQEVEEIQQDAKEDEHQREIREKQIELKDERREERLKHELQQITDKAAAQKKAAEERREAAEAARKEQLRLQEEAEEAARKAAEARNPSPKVKSECRSLRFVHE